MQEDKGTIFHLICSNDIKMIGYGLAPTENPTFKCNLAKAIHLPPFRLPRGL